MKGKDVCAITSDDCKLCVFDHRHQDKTLIKLKDNASVLAMNDTYMVAFVSFSDSYLLYKLTPHQVTPPLSPSSPSVD